MQKRHQDWKMYFEEQATTTREFVVPYLQSFAKIGKGTSILEVGCGEGGNLLPFLEMGCRVTGVDIAQSRIDNANDFLSGYKGGNLKLLAKDIYDCAGILDDSYDIIIMRDVIEHIHDQEKFMKFIKPFLGKNGLFFLAFPPWYNPFGGHQQICSNKLLSLTPYFHLLPVFLYRLILKAGGENPQKIADLLEIKETGISIERFRKISRKNNFHVVDETLYLINPNYKTKFGLNPRKQNRLISFLPHFRNYFTTCCYTVLSSGAKLPG
jgi:SAM-dependent methyltransferase